MKKDYQLGILSAEEKRLIAFYRSQNPVVKEIIMNLTHFENGLADAESATLESTVESESCKFIDSSGHKK